MNAIPKARTFRPLFLQKKKKKKKLIIVVYFIGESELRI